MIKEQGELTLRSFATINLSFDIKGVREDGYHLVETVMQQVSLFDEIKLSWEAHTGDSLDIALTTSKPYLPTDSRNLACKAAMLMADYAETACGSRPGGRLQMHIDKHIPVAAGLGGGSGNAAAVMIGLNRIWKLGLGTRTLCDMGTALGADVPFCILVQNSRYACALGKGIGEVLTPVRKGLEKHIVLAKPAFGVSTREVFREIDKCPPEERPDAQQLLEGLSRKDMKMVYRNMINVLESYTLKQYPEVQTLKERLVAAGGAGKVLMSGSGPTVIGIYNHYGAAQRACLEMRRQGYEAYWAHTGKEIRGERNVKL